MASDEISILVVEDEPAIAELIAFSVKSAGWRPVTVFSGNDAWTALQRFRPDVVLSGLDVAGFVRFAPVDPDSRTPGDESPACHYADRQNT